MKKVLCLPILSISSLAMLGAHAATYGNLRATQPYSGVIQHAKQPLFSNIDGSGNMNITIVGMGSSPREYFTVAQPAKSHDRLIAKVRQHTLYLRQVGASSKPAQVTIHMNDIDQLNLSGHAKLTAAHLQSRGLCLTTHTQSEANLKGLFTLNTVFASGSSKINIQWVSGTNVALYSTDNSRISIAGEVGTVRAKLAGHSFLNAKYLRSQHSWIKTQNFAQAEVISSRSLQAYPSDRSNIYYYKTPALLNPMNSDAGNTLQLGWDS